MKRMENKVNTAKVNYCFKLSPAKEIKGVIAREEKRLPSRHRVLFLKLQKNSQ